MDVLVGPTQKESFVPLLMHARKQAAPCSCRLRAQHWGWQRTKRPSLRRELTSNGHSDPQTPVREQRREAGPEHAARGCAGGERDGVRVQRLEPSFPQALPAAGIRIFASQLHTHLAGRKVVTVLSRDGRERQVVNADGHYSPHFQVQGSAGAVGGPGWRSPVGLPRAQHHGVALMWPLSFPPRRSAC